MGKTFGEFMDYFSVCYRRSRGSIFIGGFVGGMFLSFLMDESDKCHDRSFTQAFFIIGITHFLSNIVGGAASYAKEASQATLTDKVTPAICPLKKGSILSSCVT